MRDCTDAVSAITVLRIEVEKIEYFKEGRVQISNSPHVAPIILVRKKDGSMSPCIDYRGLNTCVVKDAFPLPRIDELLQRLDGAKVFSKLDANSGYWQMEV